MASESSRNRQVRIPPQVQRQMQKQMERSLSPSMKKYVGPYMQQNVIDPGLRGASNSPQPGVSFSPSSQTPHVVSRPKSIVFEPTNKPTGPTPETTTAYQAPVDDQPPAQPYDFIVNPEQPAKRSRLPGGDSKIVRIGFILGGLLILLILFSVIKGLLSADSNTPSLMQVAKAQQGIIHITTAAVKEDSISVSNSNFANTASLSLTSSQSRLITYMAKNGKKVKPKELALSVDLQTDKQLLAASAANTYNPTFNQIMRGELKDYMSDLKIAYSKTTGAKGKALLQDDYRQADLLLKQLDN